MAGSCDTTHEEPAMTDEREQTLKRLREMRDAYLHVFGLPGKRTFEQELVIKDLEKLTKHGDTAIVKDSTGRFDGGLTAYKNGLQDVMKRIHLRINWSEHGDGSRDSFTSIDSSGTSSDGGDASTD